MPTFPVRTRFRTLLADTVTPVSLYLRLRDRFVNTLLLESSDYHGQQNSFSFIACQPLAEFSVSAQHLTVAYPGRERTHTPIAPDTDVVAAWQAFVDAFAGPADLPAPLPYGLFGYVTYDAVRFFEDIQLHRVLEPDRQIPLLHYQLFRYVVAINHFKNELHLIEYCPEGLAFDEAGYQALHDLIGHQDVPHYAFARTGPETSNLTDAQYLALVQQGRQHCFRGDVFQIVLSRRFSVPFRGDEFNVYRALRSINPSPYLFFFDYGSFRLFGSSPEAQLTIAQGAASIHPIAGTFLRTGDDAADAELAQQLYNDPKENAEHVMLVDLARNDLSRNGSGVGVKTFKEIQYYSHVIHLVSEVTAQLHADTAPLRLVADTFPAGTLSGAPKHRALQLIDQYEPDARGYYGGALGYVGFGGDFNHAIMIRSFLSKHNCLHFQAGAGVVARSVPEKELAEVGNKLRALRRAVERAETLTR